MGSVDRILRVIIAAVFAWLYFGGIVTGTLNYPGGASGVSFADVIGGFCPLCSLWDQHLRGQEDFPDDRFG